MMLWQIAAVTVCAITATWLIVSTVKQDPGPRTATVTDSLLTVAVVLLWVWLLWSITPATQ